MSEVKFTKGPWMVTDTGDVSVNIDIPYYECLGIGVNDVAPFAVVISRRHIASRLDANANLIAAAPELYEALDALMKKYYDVMRDCKGVDVGSCGDVTYDVAGVALRKARGE